MRFTILENNILAGKSEPIVNEFYDFVREKCFTFVNQSQDIPLYRGINESYTKFNRMIFTPKKNRLPKDMPMDLHNIFEELFYDKFNWLPRSEGVFAIGDYRKSSYYGDVWRIYPTNGFKFLWSPEIQDLYVSIENSLARKQLNYSRVKLLNDDVLGELLYNLVETYQDTNLPEAIKSGHEIMIKCEHYAGIRTE